METKIVNPPEAARFHRSAHKYLSKEVDYRLEAKGLYRCPSKPDMPPGTKMESKMKRFVLAALAALSLASVVPAMAQSNNDATIRQQTGAYQGGN